MQRRDFILGLGAALALAGCGGSGSDSTGFPPQAGGAVGLPSTTSQSVNGLLQLAATDLQVYSARGPSSVKGQTFSTVTSTLGPQLIVAADGTGAVQGLSVVLPGQTQVLINAASTAMALLFMQPLFFTSDPVQAQTRSNQIQGLPEFASLTALLTTSSLEALADSGQLWDAVEAVMAKWAPTLTNTDALPTRTAARGVVTLSNPSRRGLSVVRVDLDAAGSVLTRTSLGLLEPYGTLQDQPPGPARYVVQGIGSFDASVVDGPLVDQGSFALTYVANVVLPLVELVAGQSIDPVALAGILASPALTQAAQNLQAATVTEGTSARGSLTSTSGALSLGLIVEVLTAQLASIQKLITAGSYVEGLGFSIAAVVRLQHHQDNPHQGRVTVSQSVLAAALLALPAVVALA